MKKKPSIANACASLAVSMMLVGVAEAETVQTFTIKEQTLSLDEEFVWIAKENETISYVHGAEEGPAVYPKDRYVIQLERPVSVTTSYTWGIDVSSDTKLYHTDTFPLVTLQGTGGNNNASLSLIIEKTAGHAYNLAAIQAQHGILGIDIPVFLFIQTNGERKENTAHNAVQALVEGTVTFSQPLDISAKMERNGWGLRFAAINACGIEKDKINSSTVTGTFLRVHDASFSTDKEVNVYGLLADCAENSDKRSVIAFDSVTLGDPDKPSIRALSTSGKAVFTGVKAVEWGEITAGDLTISGVDVSGGTDTSFTGVEAGTDGVVTINGKAVIQENSSSGRLYSLTANGGMLTVASGAHRIKGDIQAGIGSLYESDSDLLHAPDAILGWTVQGKVYENAGIIEVSFTGPGSYFYGFTSDGAQVNPTYIQNGSNQVLNSSINLNFANQAFWSVVPSNTPNDDSYDSKLTNLKLDGTDVYVGTTPDAWKTRAGGNTLFASSFTPLASTDKPVQLCVSNLSGTGNFYLRTDMENDRSDSVLVTNSLQGSYNLHVRASGAAPVTTQTKSYLARAEQQVGASAEAFTLKGGTQVNGQQVIDIGTYNYRLSTSERNGGREWYLERVGTDPADPTPPLSPTGETEAALSALAGHYAMWYGQLTDLRKHLGEVRYGTQTGLWARGFTDKSRLDGFGGTSFTQSMFGGSIGYDALASASEASSWIVGMQLRSARAHQSVDGHWGGHGDLTSVGGGLYSTWGHADGWYVYAVGTMDWYNHKIRTSMLDGTKVHDDRSSYGLGASLEVGRKLDFAFSNEGRDHWILEPQLQLSYFWVKGGDFHASNGMKIEQKDMDSLTGRAGFVLGKKFSLEGGNGERYVQPYVKAGVNHEFLGEQVASINGERMTSDLDGTRVYYGAGMDWQALDSLRLYMQAEHEHGEHFTREYNISCGLKWEF